MWRVPLKSAAVETVPRVDVLGSGFAGDREWGVFASDGTVMSAKDPDVGGPLLHVLATRDDTGSTSLVFPCGHQAVAGTSDCDGAMSQYLGRSARLSRDVPPGLELWRRWPQENGMTPDWNAKAQAGSRARTPVAAAARQSLQDFGAVHVITSAALARLAEQVGVVVDVRRFRANLLLDMDDDLQVGDTIAANQVRLRVTLPTPRCVVPSLAGSGLATQKQLLPTLARLHRRQVGDFGKAACFGFYAEVEVEGSLALGTSVTVERG